MPSCSYAVTPPISGACCHALHDAARHATAAARRAGTATPMPPRHAFAHTLPSPALPMSPDYEIAIFFTIDKRHDYRVAIDAFAELDALLPLPLLISPPCRFAADDCHGAVTLMFTPPCFFAPRRRILRRYYADTPDADARRRAADAAHLISPPPAAVTRRCLMPPRATLAIFFEMLLMPAPLRRLRFRRWPA